VNDGPDRSPHQILGISRRALLRAASGGAAAAAVPWAAAGTAAATTGGATAIPPPDSLPLLGGPEFPIGIFWPPHPYASTLARFQEIKDAGFTFVISGNYAADGNIFAHQLRLARDVDLKLLISDDLQIRNMSRWFTISDNPADFMAISTAEARELFRRARDAYGPYSSMAGFNHFDEPGPAFFPSLARAVAVARELAPELLPYINLFPSVDPTYYQRFVDQVRPSLVSFDRYPLLSGGREDADYFYNWTIVRQAALSADLPMWVFIQTLAYNNHREPTAAELAWQVNVSLAYGAKGIQYFTYWTPEVARGEGFGPALITVDGVRTPRYDAAMAINTSWLQQAGRQLKPLVPESVVHAGEDPLPRGAVGFTPTDWVRAVEGGPFVLGTFLDRDDSESWRWLLVANRLHSAAVTGRLRAEPATVEAIEVFDPATQTYRPAPHPAKLNLALPAGGATLVRLRGRHGH
jgi:hypothetical protein